MWELRCFISLESVCRRSKCTRNTKGAYESGVLLAKHAEDDFHTGELELGNFIHSDCKQATIYVSQLSNSFTPHL